MIEIEVYEIFSSSCAEDYCCYGPYTDKDVAECVKNRINLYRPSYDLADVNKNLIVIDPPYLPIDDTRKEYVIFLDSKGNKHPKQERILSYYYHGLMENKFDRSHSSQEWGTFFVLANLDEEALEIAEKMRLENVDEEGNWK